MGLNQIVVAPAKIMIGYAERCFEGVGPHNCARKPTWGIGGETINCNHIAFAFGHLAMYPQRAFVLAGKDPAPAAPPPEFEALFAAGKECCDDPHGGVYPSIDRIRSTYFRGMNAAIDLAGKMTDAELAKPNPIERMAKMFPTIGIALNFLLCTHPAVHIGQVSTWRRAMGLPPVNLG